MKSLKSTLCAAVVFLMGGFSQVQALDAVVIVNESSPATSITKEMLHGMYTGKTAYWEGGAAVTIVVVSTKTDAALLDASGMSPSAFKTFWQRLTFSGRGKQPKDVDSAEKAVALVAENKGAIALLPAGTEVKGAKIIEVK